MKKSKAPISSTEPEPKTLTVWAPDGVGVIGILDGRPAGRCRLGSEALSFGGDEAVSRAMLEAALDAVRNGALGNLPANRRVRLP
jgi:hypothetical protein